MTGCGERLQTSISEGCRTVKWSGVTEEKTGGTVGRKQRFVDRS